jgi:hypothetical protein
MLHRPGLGHQGIGTIGSIAHPEDIDPMARLEAKAAIPLTMKWLSDPIESVQVLGDLLCRRCVDLGPGCVEDGEIHARRILAGPLLGCHGIVASAVTEAMATSRVVRLVAL